VSWDADTDPGAESAISQSNAPDTDAVSWDADTDAGSDGVSSTNAADAEDSSVGTDGYVDVGPPVNDGWTSQSDGDGTSDNGSSDDGD
jgi:hypothetical protein